jgi:hypothetical protein
LALQSAQGKATQKQYVLMGFPGIGPAENSRPIGSFQMGPAVFNGWETAVYSRKSQVRSQIEGITRRLFGSRACSDEAPRRGSTCRTTLQTRPPRDAPQTSHNP